ncbi:hypothetical protein [Flavobacterium sp. 3-210]
MELVQTALYRNKSNVKGSSIAAAHAFAPSGSRIITVLEKLLDEKGYARVLN